jgi:glycosyltransferase involved in cell wall biosynthesis
LCLFVESTFMSHHFTNFRIFTCTPVDFAGDESFFSRDSGMFCRGLRSLGVDSQAIMPGSARLGDDPLLIRTNAENLRDAAWWRGHGLDAVILYSWAAPRYTPIAAAIKKAGIRLMVCMDTSGVISPHANSQAWFHDAIERVLLERPFGKGKIRDLAKYLVESLASPIARARIHHYRQADIVTVPTPEGKEWVCNEARCLGDNDLTSKFHYLPHPQSHKFRYSGVAKEKLIISIARWNPEDWAQKSPRVLIETYRRFLAVKPAWRGLIIGSGATKLLERLGMQAVVGLEFQERIDPDDVPALLDRSSIGFWSSRWEGQQGTAAQALCCGCSVVSHGAPMMSCFRHYVSRESGRLARSNKLEHLSEALILEAHAWEKGERNPQGISEEWIGEFHANSVASKAIEHLNLNRS